MDVTAALQEILPEARIKTRLIDRISYASDAGFYHLVPKAVVRPVNEEEVISLFRFSQSFKIPIVFRAGGTSLSGQSITDGILVDLSQGWKDLQIMDDGAMVRVKPGITGAMVNAYLKKYKRKIGPDPSSIGTAMMGGILSNNASGMCCGVQLNSYHTAKFIRFILPDGQTFSTEKKADYERFETSCKKLSDELILLKKEITADKLLYDTIRRKYRTKNTVGYSLNALIDYEHPLDIFAHLLIGGEGTLAFIAESVLETIADEPCKATSILYFKDIFDACNSTITLKNAGAVMVELMDRASLRAIEDLSGMDPFVKTLPPDTAALLIEFQEASWPELESRVNNFMAAAEGLSLLNKVTFTSDAAERDFLWKVRKGLFPAVGAVRASGTTVILEDIAFPLETMGDAILELQKLFKKYEYHQAIIFGHAKDGNIHFVITQSFNTPAEIDRYDRFLREVVQLVVNKFQGTLKAEHGTGRNMAPFVETEWGANAYQIMKRIKSAADPSLLLNPGVIINDDKQAHIKNLKQLPSVESEVDKCIECGFCEPVCPSRDVTLTPRRRIVARRALALMHSAGDHKNYKILLQQYQYDGLDTCAVDGLCGSACPVDINTGDLVKRLRRENHSPFAKNTALLVAKNFALTVSVLRLALNTGKIANRILGQKTMQKFTKVIRKVIPSFPLWTMQIPSPPDLSILKEKQMVRVTDARAIVYFPSCISRLMGSSINGKKNIMETFFELSSKAGIQVKVIENMHDSCCGQIFNSKGFGDAYSFTANKIMEQLWRSTDEGKYPVVIDVSSCAHTLHHLRPALSLSNQSRFDQLRILDSVDYLHDMVVPACTVKQKKESIVLHPVCSLKKMNTEVKFKTIATHFAQQVTIPVQAGCCGMAGDRGFLFPELTASATFFEAQEVKSANYEGYYSSTKTCEMAMSEAVNKNYESILYLANECMI
jgi:D-lactate dehydrogenase